MTPDDRGQRPNQPIHDAPNPLHGVFSRADADPSMSSERAQRCAWWGLGLSLLWLGGIGSLLGLALGGAALLMRGYGISRATTWAAGAAIVLGVAGCALTGVLAVAWT